MASKINSGMSESEQKSRNANIDSMLLESGNNGAAGGRGPSSA
jgi:hypothetical protein